MKSPKTDQRRPGEGGDKDKRAYRVEKRPLREVEAAKSDPWRSKKASRGSGGLKEQQKRVNRKG